MIVQPQEWPLWANLLLFAAGGALVWLAGSRLSGYADVIAERTGAGQAFIGALLLGGVTSLPEVATTVTASAIGNAELAANNIFGGIAIQVAVLALADAAARNRALLATIVRPSLLLEGALLILLLLLCAAAMVVGDLLVLGVGVWSTGILVSALFAFYLIQHHEERITWMPETATSADPGAFMAAATHPPPREPGTPSSDQPAGAESREGNRRRTGLDDLSTGAVVLRTVIAAAAILVAGYVLSVTADALAEQTGLGSSFVGAVLLALSTSLPEVSTTIGAVRLGAHAMAVSNIFGANILDVSILFLADAVYPGGPVFDELGSFSLTAALLGALLTAVYLVGMLERRRKRVTIIGIDSLVVVILYLGGLMILFQMR